MNSSVDPPRSARARKPAPLDPRARILAAAARLFKQQGYRATTVRDIGREAGLLSGSLFHHFASKEQMLVEMLREASIALCVGAEARLAEVDEPRARLRTLVRYELDRLVGPRMHDYYAVLISEWRDVPPEVKPELAALRRRYRAIGQSVLQSCAQAGLLRVPADAAALMLHGITTSALSWFDSRGEYSTDEFADQIVRLLLDDEPAS